MRAELDAAPLELGTLWHDRPQATLPVASARLRVTLEDFAVVELPAFEPMGHGEHLLVRVRKRGANTDWIASQLARWAQVPRSAVGYAGRKDRYASAEQWFSLHLPGRANPEPSLLQLPELELLQLVRHNRKLRRGALRGNRFQIVLREVSGEPKRVDRALNSVAATGYPNYFGDQRFGVGGVNLAPWTDGGWALSRNRTLRGLQLSAARSLLFNRVLARRVREGSWDQALEGEVLFLNGTQRWFRCDQEPDAELRRRVAQQDLHPSGPLWGAGELPSAGTVRSIERSAAASLDALRQSLEQIGMRQERRALRARAHSLRWSWLDPSTLRMDFELARGCFATSFLETVFELASPNSSSGTSKDGGIHGGELPTTDERPSIDRRL